MSGSGPSELGVVMRQGGYIRRPAPRTKVDGASQKLEPTQAMSTRIFVKGLSVETECGVYAHEKGKKRPLIVDIEVQIAATVRSTSDELAQTVDYDSLAAHVHHVAGATHLHLIETFAERVCELVLSDPRIEWVKLRVEKPNSVSGAISSGVEIERIRSQKS
jgi:7,8-dihydroneopterin aldolase/epimerase/oxygenase